MFGNVPCFGTPHEQVCMVQLPQKFVACDLTLDRSHASSLDLKLLGDLFGFGNISIQGISQQQLCQRL